MHAAFVRQRSCLKIDKTRDLDTLPVYLVAKCVFTPETNFSTSS